MWSVQTGKSTLPVFILFLFMPNLIAPLAPSECAGENPTSLCSLTTLCLGFFFLCLSSCSPDLSVLFLGLCVDTEILCVPI